MITAKQTLTVAIDAFKEKPTLTHIGTLDDYGLAVLGRLEREPNVARAFAQIPRPEWQWVLHDAIMADRVARAPKGKNPRDITDAARKARRALNVISKYLGPDDREKIEAVAQAIYMRESTDATFAALAPRKGDKASARVRGIGWIKDSVARASGRPNLEAATKIADAALDMGLVSLDMMKHAPTPNEAIKSGLRRRKLSPWQPIQVGQAHSHRKNRTNAP